MSALEAEVHRRLIEEGLPDPAVEGRVARLVREAAPLLPAAEVAEVVARVRARVSGLGVLDPLLEDASVTDLLVNGPGPVWVDRAGRLEPTEVLLDRAAIDLLVERILAPVGRRVDPASPVVDARLADGSRVHVVVPPLAIDGPCVAIRRFSTRQVELDEVASPSVAALLAWAVRARANIVVSGATGSGKTTLLNALAAHVPAGERIVTIEDAAELRLPAEHVVRLETRPGSVEGVAEVSCRDLVRSALRLRPDRIVVGEVRGGEALELVAAMNTGHDGSLSTVHANGCEDALRRLETLVLLAGVALPLEAVRDHLAAAVDLVVHIARDRDGHRRVVEVAEVCPPGIRPASADRRATWSVADAAGAAAAAALATGPIRWVARPGVVLAVTGAAWGPAGLPPGVVSALTVAALGAAVLSVRSGASGAAVRRRLWGGPDPGPPPSFATGWLALDLPATPEAAWPWAARAAAGASALLAVRAPEVLLVSVVAGVAARAAARSRGRRRADRDLDRALPAVLDDVVAAMASGASLLQALDQASERGGAVGTELLHLLQRRAQGLGLQEVLDDWAARRPETSVGLLADALALAGATGGSQVGALRSVVDTLREREALQREVGAMAAQAQLSASVLVVVPAAFAVVVAVLDRRIAAFLLANPLGWACLAVGAALDGAGAWWMRRLVRAVT